MNQQEFSPFDSMQEASDKLSSSAYYPDEVREQKEQVSDYITPEQSMLKGEKLTSTRRKKKLYINIIGLVLVVLMTFFGLSIWQHTQNHVNYQHSYISAGPKSAPGSNSSLSQSIPVLNFSGTQTFSVSGYPEISINNMNQDVHIHVGADNKITVSETAKHNELGNLHLNLVNGNQVEVIDSNYDDPNPPNLSGELDITVPAYADVVVNSTSTNNVSPHNVFINGVTGQVQVDTIYGDIHLQQTHLTGSSSLTDANGNIDFAGTLDLNSTTSITAYNGAVNVSLPSDAAFGLWYKGNLIRNDFRSDSVGNPPQAGLSIEADNGSITIQKADS